MVNAKLVGLNAKLVGLNAKLIGLNAKLFKVSFPPKVPLSVSSHPLAPVHPVLNAAAFPVWFPLVCVVQRMNVDTHANAQSSRSQYKHFQHIESISYLGALWLLAI